MSEWMACPDCGGWGIREAEVFGVVTKVKCLGCGGNGLVRAADHTEGEQG